MQNKLTKLLLLLFCILTAIALSGCSSSTEAVIPTATPSPTSVPTPVPTPTPVIDVFTLEALPEETPLPAPTITPTPIPEETPIPFSYYAPTVNMSFEELVGSTDDVKAQAKNILAAGYPDPDTYYIIVDIYWQVVMVYKKGPDGKPDLEQPVRYMLCSTGNPKVGSETARGIFPLKKARVRFGQFLSGESGQYWTLIRSKTYFHSILYKKDKDISSYMIDSYNNLGSKASHACIRLPVPDARWIFYNCGYGTLCEIRDGSKNDSDTALIRSQLILPPAQAGLKLVAGQQPWTDNWTIEDVPHELEYKYEAPPRATSSGDSGSSSSSSSSGSSAESPSGSSASDPN